MRQPAALLVAAGYTWSQVLPASAGGGLMTLPAPVIGLLFLGLIGGFVTALVTVSNGAGAVGEWLG